MAKLIHFILYVTDKEIRITSTIAISVYYRFKGQIRKKVFYE